MSDIPSRLAAALADRYRIERELGEGGMAVVYLADDLKHDRKVALKVLKPELAAVVGGERFLAEIKTTANLQHPHILPLFDSGASDTFLWYAMPYVEGESLEDRLRRERQLPVGEAVAIASKVAGALQAAHDRGVVHRDIKPANILLANGEPLVADFGIALAVQEAGGGRLTETGLSMGTPFYMSPEQATADRTPDARSDVYSLGCVLYEMLAGEPPFTGSSAQAVLGRILTQEAPSVTVERGSVPPHVDAVIRHALQKLPADRIESAAEFVKSLRDPNRLSGGFTSGLHAGSASTARPASRRVSVFAGIAAISMLVAIWAVVTRGDAVSDVDPVPARFILEDRAVLSSERGSRAVQISADGRAIVYRGLSEGRNVLFRRSIDSTGARPIPGTEDVEFHAISPDSRWLAFLSSDGGLKRVPLEGGAPSDMIAPEEPPIGIAWSTPSEIVMGMLAYSDISPGLSSVAIGDTDWTVRTDVKTAREQENTWGMHHEPYPLSDGDHVLYIDFRSEGVFPGVANLRDGTWRILDLKGSEMARTDGIVGVADDVFLYKDRADRLMVIGWDPDQLETFGEPIAVPGAPAGLRDATISENGTLVMTLQSPAYQPVLVDDRGAVVRPLGTAGVGAFFPRLSPDGRTLAVATELDDDAEIELYDVVNGSSRPAGLGHSWYPVWFDQGRRLLTSEDQRFRSRDNGIMTNLAGIIGRPIDFSEVTSRVLRFGRADVSLLDVSPDGRHALFLHDKELNPALTQLDLAWAELNGDTIAFDPDENGEVDFDNDPIVDDPPLVDFEASVQPDFAGRFSPDGRWIAYTSAESGRPNVYIRPFPGPGARVQVSGEPSGSPVWDSTGNRLYFRTQRGLRAANLNVRAGAIGVTSIDRLFDLDFYGSVASLYATYEVHPEGFIVAIDETDTNGQVVVWTHWLHEVQALLAEENGG